MMRDIYQGILPVEELSERHALKEEKTNKENEIPTISSRVHKECVGNNMSENGEKLYINTNKHNMANAPEEYKNKADGELTNEKHELRKRMQKDTKLMLNANQII